MALLLRSGAGEAGRESAPGIRLPPSGGSGRTPPGNRVPSSK